MVDFFGNVPDIVIDKILEKLPIDMAAQSSVLSKRWRCAWLSLRILLFDNFCFARIGDSRRRREIISNILFCHNGPVHEFHLYDWDDDSDFRINYNSWISFLSGNGARKIVISNINFNIDITSNIFCCSEIVHLNLAGFTLNPPPMNFIGFPNLKHLELRDIVFSKRNIFGSLIENCRKLETAILTDWSGLDHVVIDAPSLQTLVLRGEFEYFTFSNIRNLKSISMCTYSIPDMIATDEIVDAVNLLASSCQLQSMEFNGCMCEFLVAGGIRSFTSVTFYHLNNLCLSDLYLCDFGLYPYVLSMIECCPNIKTLNISLIDKKSVGQNVLDLEFNPKCKLNNLREVNIDGIMGSNESLKLVEYVLAISPSLEKLFFKYGYCDIESKLKMSEALMRFPRASPKASLVCLQI